MTVLEATPHITSVVFKGLDDLILPFTSHLIEGSADGLNPEILAAQTADADDKYYVKSITGLEPPDQTVAIARTPAGGVYQGKSSEDRELVVLIGLEPDWDAGETPKILRDNLYTMLSPGPDPKIDVQLYAAIFPIAHDYAYITKFEATIFDQNPAVQLTMTCLNDKFRDFGPTTYAPDELNEKYPNIYNYATADTGFQFAIKFTDDMASWFIKDAENQSIGMEIDGPFHDGDILSISTIPGRTFIHLKRHRKKVKNWLGNLKNSSEFLQLYPGMNHFVTSKPGKWEWKGKLSFTAQYWGV